MFDLVAASLSGVANLCLAGVFAALWWIDRKARFNLNWAGGFAAVGIASVALTAYRATDHFALLALTVMAMGPAVALLFTGTRHYTGKARPRELVSALAVVWGALALCGLFDRDWPDTSYLQTLVGSLFLAVVFGWMGVTFLARPAIERATGALFLARACLLAGFPFIPAAAIAPFFVLVHFMVLATGLALLMSAFMRNRTRLEEEESERLERATRLDILYQETPALLVVLGADRLVAAVSNDWLRFTGYTRDEVMGRDALGFVAPEMRARIAGDVVQQLEYQTRIDEFEHQVVRKDGTTASVRTAMRAHRNPVTGRLEVIALSVDESARKLAEQAARRTEYLLERIVNLLPAAVTVKDQNLRLTLWNRHASLLFGLPTGEVLGRQLSEASSNPAAGRMEAVDRAVLAGARPPAHEIQVTIEGESRWIMMDKAPLLSPDGVVEGVVSAALDITEQKRVQAELQQSQEFLVQAQRLGRTGYIAADLPAQRVTWSETMFEIRGVPPRPWFTFEEAIAFIHPDDLPAYRTARDIALAEKRPYEIELRVVRPDGEIIWEHSIGHPQFGPDGNITGLLVFVQDVTGRRHAEEALRDSEAKFSGAFAGTAEAMVITRRSDDIIVEMNGAAERLFGWPRGEMIDKSRDALNIWVDPAELQRVRQRFAETGELHDYPAQLRNRSGQEMECILAASRFETAIGGYNFWIIRDVTEARQAERRIATLNAANEAALRQIRNIADNLPVLIAYADRDRRCRFINRTGEMWYARPASQLIGERISDLNKPSMITPLAPVIAEVLKGHQQKFEARLLYPDGVERDVELTYVPEALRDGSINGYYTLATDITERKRIETALQRSREDLVQAQRLGRTGHVRSDYRTGRLVWSDSMFELRGVPWRESFSLEEGMAFVHPDDLQVYVVARDAAIANRTRFDAEVRILRPDGKLQWEHASGHPQFDEAGTAVGMLLVVQDVTERKLAEIALRASEARFAGAFHGSTDMMSLMHAADGRFVEVNETWLNAVGFSRAEVIGRTAGELGFWADEEERQKVADLRASGKRIKDLEMKMRLRGGQVRDVRISGSRVTLGDDDYYFWVGRDVTEEQEIQRRIASLNAANEAALRQIRNIAHNLPVLIAHADRSRRYLFINRTGEQWFARPASEIVGKSLAEIMGQGFTESSADIVAEVLAGQPRTIERRILYPDGKERDVEVVYVPDIGEDGTVTSYYSLVTDITDRRATEMQLRQAQRMEAIGKLTGGVAHDFNNLLGVISGNLELVDESIQDEELRKLVRTAIRATERGATLTRSLLAYSRQQPLMPQAVEVDGLVREMAEMFQRTMPRSIEIEVVAGAGLWRCEADPGQLQNALLNLVVNARDAMPEGGRLTIESANARLDDDYAATHAEVAPGQYVVLAVSDTGAGMPEQILARAFDPFFTTKEVGKGTGLGLSMVYGFAKQSRGHVKIYSEVGHGTTVRLYLPRAVDTTEEPVATPIVTASRGETVLLVEDSPDFRTLTFALLRSFGYHVLEAADAQTGLRLLEQHPETALLLTDVVLPGEMNGERLAARAKAMRPHLRVLYMSGYTENAILHHGRLDRGVQLLQKPFRKHDLAAKVRAALDREEPPS